MSDPPIHLSQISAAELATTIFAALRQAQPSALVQGDPANGRKTLIDGTFNLLDLAEKILVSLADLRPR